MQKAPVITLGLVDDHTSYRQTLSYFLSTQYGYAVTVQAGNGLQLQVILAKASPPQLLFLDVRMEEMDGFATLEWLHRAHPELPVVMLTGCDTTYTAANFINLGARAVLTKNVEVTTLHKTIERVLEDGHYFPDNQLLRLFRQRRYRRDGAWRLPALLTHRDLQMMRLVGKGLSNLVIAGEMGYTEAYVKKCLNDLFEKTEVDGRAGLVQLAERHGISGRGGTITDNTITLHEDSAVYCQE